MQAVTTQDQQATTRPAALTPHERIEAMWSHMRRSWGTEFDRKWAPPAGMSDEALEAHYSDLKDHWISELRGFKVSAIRYAMDNLPERPCTLPEFKSICRRAPEFHRDDKTKALPIPANRAAAAKVKAATSGVVGISADPLARQRQHMVQEIAGIHVSSANKQFWRMALRAEVSRLYGMDTAIGKIDLAELGRRISDRANKGE